MLIIHMHTNAHTYVHTYTSTYYKHAYIHSLYSDGTYILYKCIQIIPSYTQKNKVCYHVHMYIQTYEHAHIAYIKYIHA